MVVEAPVAHASRITMEEFIALVERNPERHYKFDARGDVVEMSPKWVHGDTQGEIVMLLKLWLRGGALPGYRAATEVVHEIGGWRCRPDVAIQPGDCEPIPREAPLLAVEIRSESNPRRELRAKAARYLERGTQMVWLVYPETRSLELCRAGEAAQTLSAGEVLEGGETLPGFRVSVSELFPPPQRD